jgi:hypothetical protein
LPIDLVADERDDIAKEIVALSNAYGGVIIVGIEETDDNPRRSKQIHSPMIPRVTDCAEQLAQSLRGIIDPPLPMLEARGIGPDGLLGSEPIEALQLRTSNSKSKVIKIPMRENYKSIGGETMIQAPGK